MAFKDTGDIKPFVDKIWLSSPTMHGEELTYMEEAYRTNWMSTVGKNINEIESQVAQYIGVNYAVALSAGTAALHLATKLAGDSCTDRRNQTKERLTDIRFSQAI